MTNPHGHHCIIALLCLIPITVAGQLSGQDDHVRGNLRLEVIQTPAAIARDFERLNPQALLYHPVQAMEKKSPLLIVLHGSGGSKRSIERAKWTGEVRRFLTPSKGQPTTHILVPQSNGHWDPDSLNKMLDYILKATPSIDTRRIYCVGYSMGGKGTWEWAMNSPERFAAIIPKAFIPDLSGLDAMVELPIWAMVGTRDTKPRVTGIQEMERSLKRRGSKVVKTTFFDGANHGSAQGKIKKLEGVYDWLFSHPLPE